MWCRLVRGPLGLHKAPSYPPRDLFMQAFSPFEQLAGELLPHLPAAADGSHDMGHLCRVWRNALAIRAEEGGDARIVAAAVLLHDCVHVEKNAPQRSLASRLAGERAAAILAGLGWPAEEVADVVHAIEAHSFTAGIAPRTLEAKIVQDADRLDAIGFVGVARCFYIAGRLGSALYDLDDPDAAHRPLDGTRFALDHFPEKLLRLGDGFQTATGRRLAQERMAAMRGFLEGFRAEI